MGRRGTEVARDAADIVLNDDAFGTIVAAVRHGRIIFVNIRRFIVYLLSGNLGEVAAVSIAAGLGAPLPLLPLQILFINLVNDVMPALALGVSRGDPHVMARPPRNAHEPILTRGHWIAIAGYSAVLAASALGAMAIALWVLGLGETAAITVSFLTFGLSRLWHVFNMRDSRAPVFRNDVTRNRFVWLAIAFGIVLLLSAVYVPILADVLQVVVPDWRAWTLIVGASLVPLVVGQLAKIFRSRTADAQ
jgi:Ca2+-transporting ATPase